MTTIIHAKQYLIASLSVLVLVGTASVMGASDNFSSDAARVARSSGSPVGPPKKFVVCHKGKSISVAEAAVPAHLAHGDTLGECPNEVVVCHGKDNTLIIKENNLPGHLAHGDTLGPCPQRVFMCNNLGNTIVVKSHRIAEHQARGHTLGLCPGKQLICHKGKTIKVDDKDVAKHLEHGDYVGYCLGDQGPLISTNVLPPQVTP